MTEAIGASKNSQSIKPLQNEIYDFPRKSAVRASTTAIAFYAQVCKMPEIVKNDVRNAVAECANMEFESRGTLIVLNPFTLSLSDISQINFPNNGALKRITIMRNDPVIALATRCKQVIE
jgi:hypothetical protein